MKTRTEIENEIVDLSMARLVAKDPAMRESLETAIAWLEWVLEVEK